MILQEYRNDQAFIEKFKLAETAWENFRDAHINSIFPAEDKQLNYGTVFPLCYYIELVKLTKERIKQLSPWINGIAEGDVCAGSRKIKH